MIPYGLTQAQFVKRYCRWLDTASAKLIEELRKLFASQLPSTVTSAEMQVFMGDWGRDKPSAWIYFDGMNKKVDHNDTSIFPGRALEIPLGIGMMPDFDEQYFESDAFPGVDLQADTLKTGLPSVDGRLAGGHMRYLLRLRFTMALVMGSEFILRSDATRSTPNKPCS